MMVPTATPRIGTPVTWAIMSVNTGFSARGFITAPMVSNLRQAIPIIMGANIGTTITAQIIAFKLSDYVLGIVLVGFIAADYPKRPAP